MAELQRLLQSIQEGKVPMPPGLLNLITFDQNQVPVINLSPPADGRTNDGGSNSAGLIAGHPSPGECDSGYTSMKGDTPGSSQSESPVTAALLTQVPLQPLDQKPSPRASVSTQQSIQSQYSVQFSPPCSSPKYSINTPMADHVSPVSDMRASNDALRNSAEYDYDRKPNIHHFNQNNMNAKRNFAQVDNYHKDTSSPSLDNLNCMNEVLSHMKQEQMSPESCLNGVHPSDACVTDTKPPQDNIALIEQNKQAIKKELEAQMINLSYKDKSPSPELASQVQSGACNVQPEKTVPNTRYRSCAPARSLGAVGGLLNDARAAPSGEKWRLVENVTQTIIEAHMDTCNYTTDKIAAGFKKYEEQGPGEMPAEMKAMMMGVMGGANGMMNGMIDGGNGTMNGTNGMMGGPNGMMDGPNGLMGGANGMMGGTNGMMGGTNGMMGGANSMMGGNNGMMGSPNGMMVGPNGMMGGPNGMMGGPNGMMGGPNGMMGGPNGMNGTNGMSSGPNGMMPGDNDKSSGDPSPVSAMWTSFVKGMVPVITRVVNFSKRLPGFGELTQEDQIRLIKQGSFEVAFIRYTKLFDEDGMMVPTMDFKVPRMMINRMPMGRFFTQQLEFALVFNPIILDDAEVGLYTSIMIMNADRIDIVNKKAVGKLQGLFLQCLFHYMKKHRPENFEEVFTKVIRMLPDLREINEMHAVHLNKMKMNLPDLHSEVFTDSDPLKT